MWREEFCLRQMWNGHCTTTGHIFFHTCSHFHPPHLIPSAAVFPLFQHTNTHTNKAAEAAGRALIRPDRAQWHPWHFRGKACSFSAPQGCLVRLWQTVKSLWEWTAEGCWERTMRNADSSYSYQRTGGLWNEDIHLCAPVRRVMKGRRPDTLL